MANMQIKGIDPDLYEEIRGLAASENRSISQQILYLVRDYLTKRKRVEGMRTPAEVLLGLAGSWSDERSAAGIVSETRKARRNSGKLREGL